jgi:signal transduction histidine kinase
MCAADDSPDGFVHDAADQLRHDLLSPLTTISARTQLLARDLRRSPSLAEDERTRMLTGIMAIEAAVQSMCAVIDAMRDEDRGS